MLTVICCRKSLYVFTSAWHLKLETAVWHLSAQRFLFLILRLRLAFLCWYMWYVFNKKRKRKTVSLLKQSWLSWFVCLCMSFNVKDLLLPWIVVTKKGHRTNNGAEGTSRSLCCYVAWVILIDTYFYPYFWKMCLILSKLGY